MKIGLENLNVRIILFIMPETLLHPNAPEFNEFNNGDAFNLLDFSITPLGDEGIALGGLAAESILTDPNRLPSMASGEGDGCSARGTCSTSCQGSCQFTCADGGEGC
jgi:hypothetical protein